METHRMQKIENTSILILLYKTQLEMDQDLSIGPDTLNLTEEKLDNTLNSLKQGLPRDFLGTSQWHRLY